MARSLEHLHNSDVTVLMLKLVRISKGKGIVFVPSEVSTKCTETSSAFIDPRVMRWQGEEVSCSLPLGNFTLEMPTGGFSFGLCTVRIVR